MNYILYLLLIIIIIKVTNNKESFYFKQDIHTENRVKINNDNYYSKGEGYFVSVNSLHDKLQDEKQSTQYIINQESNINEKKINTLFNKIMNYNITLLDEVN